MLSLPHGKRVALFLGLAFVMALLLAASTSQPVGFERRQVCLRCGLSREQRVFFNTLSTPWSEHTTKLTRWYAARVGTPHDHVWEPKKCSALLNIWQMPVGSRCYAFAEPIAVDPDAFGALFERMQPLGLDLQAHATLTYPNKEIRTSLQRGARNALGGTQDELKAWWTSTAAVLRELEAHNKKG